MNEDPEGDGVNAVQQRAHEKELELQGVTPAKNTSPDKLSKAGKGIEADDIQINFDQPARG